MTMEIYEIKIWIGHTKKIADRLHRYGRDNGFITGSRFVFQENFSSVSWVRDAIPIWRVLSRSRS